MTTSVAGQCDPRFAQLREEFERNFSERGESGASVCLSVNGEPLVDLWGGLADRDAGTPWTQDTVSIVFSCTKGTTALCAHLLIDRGELALDAPVTDYWPEFGAHGKDGVTVAMMLNHESGLPALREPVKENGFLDWEYMVERLAGEAPFWEPGTRNVYHMVTFGWTVGELVRRVSGQSLGSFFRNEIAEPLGSDFWIGIPEEFSLPIAPILPYEPPADEALTEFATALVTDPASAQALSLLNVGGWWPNDPATHRAQIGGGGGIGNARALSRMYAPLARNDGSLVSRERVAHMSSVTTASQRDFTLLIPSRFGPGFMKSMDNRGIQPASNRQSVIMGSQAFGHVGAGGSIGFADPECGLAFGYTMSQMGSGVLLNERGQRLVDAAYRALGYRTDAPGAWIK